MRSLSVAFLLSIPLALGACGDSTGSNTSTGSGTGNTTTGSGGSSANPFAMDEPDEHALGPFEGEEMEDVLAGHNDVREDLGLDAMEWVDSLAIIAGNWAEQCPDEDGDLRIDHNVDLDALGLGENIWTGTRSRAGSVAVEAWVEEVDDYDYDDNSCADGAVCGHYTQVVWAGTNQVGCARAFCEHLDFQHVIVCNYRPPGNTVGEKPY